MKGSISVSSYNMNVITERKSCIDFIFRANHFTRIKYYCVLHSPIQIIFKSILQVQGSLSFVLQYFFGDLFNYFFLNISLFFFFKLNLFTWSGQESQLGYDLHRCHCPTSCQIKHGLVSLNFKSICKLNFAPKVWGQFLMTIYSVCVCVFLSVYIIRLNVRTFCLLLRLQLMFKFDLLLTMQFDASI